MELIFEMKSLGLCLVPGEQHHSQKYYIAQETSDLES